MPVTLGNEALEYLLANAGLTLTESQKSELQSIHEHMAVLKARVRQKRGHMAEPAHTYGFTKEDLA